MKNLLNLTKLTRDEMRSLKGGKQDPAQCVQTCTNYANQQCSDLEASGFYTCFLPFYEDCVSNCTAI